MFYSIFGPLDSIADFYFSNPDSLDVIKYDDYYVLRFRSQGSFTNVTLKEYLLAAMKEVLQKLMDLLQLREHQARTLLSHYRWDAEKLVEVLVEKGEASLFTEAGITVNEDTSSSPPFFSALICNICIEEVPGDKVTKMDCGHSFCNDCWTKHFIVKINEGQTRRIRCMVHECNTICDEAVVSNLVRKKRPDLAEKFDCFLLESYIENNKIVKWCPSIPQCGNAILVKQDEFCEVGCACGLQFCFRCLSEPHLPCSCSIWKRWTRELGTKKCQDESKTIDWIADHTKPCPKCHKPVEKNGGCSNMTCVCGHKFCWLCGGATGRGHTCSGIAGQSFGQYEENNDKITERAELDPHDDMHYLYNYKAHADSFKLESKLKETIPAKVSILEKRDSTLKDFSWANTGLHILLRARRFLSCSYPFAFYMFGGKLSNEDMSKEERETKQLLFKIQQQQLEEKVETLSKLLEEPFEQYPDHKVWKIRMQVINLSGIVHNLCKKMYEFIENDLWLSSS